MLTLFILLITIILTAILVSLYERRIANLYVRIENRQSLIDTYEEYVNLLKNAVTLRDEQIELQEAIINGDDLKIIGMAIKRGVVKNIQFE